MKLPRAIVRCLCRLLAAAVLFAQLMVTAYACPGLAAPAGGLVTGASQDASAMPPGCDQMDRDNGTLCAEHCRFGQQSADTAQPPAVQPAVPTLLYQLPSEALPAAGATSSLPASAAQLAAAPPPPHAILHCVLRI